MKFTEGESLADDTENQIVTGNGHVEDTSKFYCPTCTTLMIELTENGVQCDILTEKNGLLTIVDEINNGRRRGSVQSITEIQEDVPYEEEVAMLQVENAPNEIQLVTRSFENEAVPIPPRRSSIAQFLDGIKSLGNRRKSDPPLSKLHLDVDIPEKRSGVRRGSVELSPMQENDSNQDTIINSSKDNLYAKDVQRKSFQLDNGTMVEEETAEYDANLAISADETSAPGEVNFISRSFETVHDNPSPRRESIIDKLNFFKMLGNIGKGNNQRNNEEPAELPQDMGAVSGVRRKSLAPALLLQNGIIDEEEEEENERCDDSSTSENVNSNGAASASLQDLCFPNSARYVTEGIRRGSVAAVTSAPPFRMAAQLQQNNGERKESDLSLPEEDTTANARYVVDGIRRGSVAMVSAAPPCICPNADADNQSSTELQVDGPDCLRSGIRRRSLSTVNDDAETTSPSTSPSAAKRVAFNSLRDRNNLDEETAEDRARKSSDAADEFMNRVKERYEGESGKKKKKEEKKGAVSLFEELTGRKMGVDYSTIDARSIQEKLDEEFDEKQRAFQRTSIPIITFNCDETEREKDEIETDNQNGEDRIVQENEISYIANIDSSSNELKMQTKDTNKEQKNSTKHEIPTEIDMEMIEPEKGETNKGSASPQMETDENLNSPIILSHISKEIAPFVGDDSILSSDHN